MSGLGKYYDSLAECNFGEFCGIGLAFDMAETRGACVRPGGRTNKTFRQACRWVQFHGMLCAYAVEACCQPANRQRSHKT